MVGGLATSARHDDPFAMSALKLDSPVLGPSSYKRQRLAPHKMAGPPSGETPEGPFLPLAKRFAATIQSGVTSPDSSVRSPKDSTLLERVKLSARPSGRARHVDAQGLQAQPRAA